MISFRSTLVIFVIAGTGVAAAACSPVQAKPKPPVTVTAPAVTVTAPAVTVTATPAITVTKTAKPPSPVAVMTQDGVYLVGGSGPGGIKPGVYQTRGAKPSSFGNANCYYALLSSTNTSDIIDNANVTGPATITVGAGVKAVQVQGCKPWHKIG